MRLRSNSNTENLNVHLVNADTRSLPCALCPASNMERFPNMRGLLASFFEFCLILVCWFLGTFYKRPHGNSFVRLSLVQSSFNFICGLCNAQLFWRQRRVYDSRTEILSLFCSLALRRLWLTVQFKCRCCQWSSRTRISILNGKRIKHLELIGFYF